MGCFNGRGFRKIQLDCILQPFSNATMEDTRVSATVEDAWPLHKDCGEGDAHKSKYEYEDIWSMFYLFKIMIRWFMDRSIGCKKYHKTFIRFSYNLRWSTVTDSSFRTAQLALGRLAFQSGNVTQPTATGVWLCFPLMWANPFTDRSLTCSEAWQVLCARLVEKDFLQKNKITCFKRKVIFQTSSFCIPCLSSGEYCFSRT